MKISEGCNHRCSFCIIPSLRGDLDSRQIDEVLQEAQNLVSAGVRELLIISQDTSAYGVDTKYRTHFYQGRPVKTRFYDLAKELSQLGVWVRLHYVYPYPHVDEIIPLMSTDGLLPYLDIPFQHASASILKTMRRPAHSENTLARIRQWRAVSPDLKIRSTFIVGFPGETEQDFKELLNFLEQAQLDRVGCFAYSPVQGAAANQLTGQVPEDIKQQRLEQFMELQSQISADKLKQAVGSDQTVLVDRVEDGKILARTYGDAPEIDGLVIIEDPTADVTPGDFIDVKITASDDYDLYGKICRTLTQ